MILIVALLALTAAAYAVHPLLGIVVGAFPAAILWDRLVGV